MDAAGATADRPVAKDIEVMALTSWQDHGLRKGLDGPAVSPGHVQLETRLQRAQDSIESEGQTSGNSSPVDRVKPIPVRRKCTWLWTHPTSKVAELTCTSACRGLNWRASARWSPFHSCTRRRTRYPSGNTHCRIQTYMGRWS